MNFSQIYQQNLTLFNNIINTQTTEYPTFVHIKSYFPDKWYNFIVPTFDSSSLEINQIYQLINTEKTAGVETSYYLNKSLYTSYQSFLTEKGLSEIGNDVYMLKGMSEDIQVPNEQNIVELTSAMLEEYLALSQTCFPEWPNNKNYCMHFYKLSQENDIKDKIVRTFLLTQNATIVAFSSIVIDKSIGLAYLHNSGTHPKFRKQGFHTLMVNFRCNYALQNGATSVYAIVEELSNSFSNFKKMGFDQKDKFYVFF